MKYIIAIGIFQSGLAAAMLWRSKFKNTGDSLLVMLMVCIGVHLSIKFFIYSFVTDDAVLNMMNTFVGFCYLPLVYLYTLKAIQPEFVPASKWYVFIPFFIASIAYFSVVSVLTVAAEAGYGLLYWYNKLSFWTLTVIDILVSCYVILLAIRHLPRFSKERRLILQIAGMFILMGSLGVIFSMIYMQGPYLNYFARGVIYTLMIVVCVLIVKERYVAFVNPTKDSQAISETLEQMQKTSLHHLPDEANTDADQYQSSSDKRKTILKEDELLNIILKLESAMSVECYYKDNELTLDKLATHISQNKYRISEALNHYLGKPFYTFVNEYRVKHVIRRLERLSKNELEVNMLNLAYDAGFNSKSSFNRYFKELTGYTPTTYYKKMLAERAEFTLCLNAV